MDRKFRQNGFVLLLSLLLCLSLWHIMLNPTPVIDANYSVGDGTDRTFNYIINSANTTYSYPMQTLQSGDYDRLMDLTDFRFTIINQPCNDSHPLLLILIHSSPENWERRKDIRSTWGQKMDNVVVLFMIGATSKREVQEGLERENEQHRDFVQGNFPDSYRNLTYKHDMVLKYAVYHCPVAKYVLKTDDDIFVNLITYMEFLHEVLTPNGTTDFLMCQVRRNSRPLRSYRSKWRVSVHEYPKTMYPDMCPGWALLYSNDLVFKMYRELQNSTFFWIDDVLVTGILMNRLKLKLVSSTDWIISKRDLETIAKYPKSRAGMHEFLYGPPEKPKKVYEFLWHYVKNFVKSKNFYYDFQKNSSAPQPLR